MAPKFNLRTTGTDTPDLEYKGAKLTYLDMDENFINFTTGSSGHDININTITTQGNITSVGNITSNIKVITPETNTPRISSDTNMLVIEPDTEFNGNVTIGGDIQINSGHTRITGKTRVLLGNVIENFPVTASGTSLSLPYPSGESSTYMSDQIKRGKKFKVTFEFTRVGTTYDSASVSLVRKDSSTAAIYPYTGFSVEDTSSTQRTLFSWGEYSTDPTISISAHTNIDGEKIYFSYYIFSDFLAGDRVIFSKDGSSHGGYGSILTLNSSYGNEIEFSFNSQVDNNFTVTVLWEEILEITEVV